MVHVKRTKGLNTLELPETEIKIVENLEELARTAAWKFVHLAAEAVQAKGRFTVILSGGQTPRGLYTLLASKSHPFRERIPWERIHFFWGDERHVPPDNSDSNFRMAQEEMLSKVPLVSDNVHRIKAENPSADGAAEDYEKVLRDFFHLKIGELPRFDLVLLGMGSDGHTASLFPGTSSLTDREHLVAASWIEKLKTFRVTLTPPVLRNAAWVIFLVSGEEKAGTLKAVLKGDYHPEQLPSQFIRPVNGKLLWLVERSSAQLLDLEGEVK